MSKIKFSLAMLVASLFLFTNVWAAERTAPTFPKASSVESGKTYYLYNVGAEMFLTRSTVSTSYPGVGKYAKAVAVDVSAMSDGSYTLRFSDDKYYIYAQLSSMFSRSSVNRECYFTIAGTADGYTIQRAPANTTNYKENQFVGYPGDAADDRIVPNLTEGNITWKFIEKEAAEYYIAKRRLYDALLTITDSYFYIVDNFEKVYNDPASSTELLNEAADNIESGLLLSSKYVARSWSDYPIFFINDSEQNWQFNNGSKYYDDYLNIYYPKIGTYTLKAIVKNDENATLSYMLYDYYGTKAEVYIDGTLVHKLSGNILKYKSGYKYSRYFDKLAPGTHVIEWRFNCTLSYSYNGLTIRDIGIEKTPYFEVSLLEPGSLGTEVLYNVDHIKDVRRIKIKGKMNDDDWAKISMMVNLYSIDLSEADVKSIPANQFNNNSGDWPYLHEIVLPNTLESIGNSAFYQSYIDKVTFPASLKTIGEKAFYNSMISEAILPDNMTSIGSYAFYECFQLKNAHYPNNLTSVPESCFNNCYYLAYISLPNELTTIYSSAFANCKMLNIPIPKNIKYIHFAAFSNCYEMNPRFPKTVKTIYEKAFENCAMDSLIIPAGCAVRGFDTSEKYGAFCSCDNLVYAEFPTNFYSADYRYSQIESCSNLKTLVFRSPTVVGGNYKSDFLNGCPSDVVIKVPSFLVNSYKLDEYWYNYKIEGFNTGDIKDWVLNSNLVMNARERFDGKPNLTIKSGGSIKLNGDAAQLIDTLHTVSYNYYNGTSSDAYARILVNNDATKILGRYTHEYYVTGKYWYFVSLPFDFKISDVTPSVEGTKFVFRYYDGATRAANGASGNWKNYAEDAIITAGTGFIVQANASCYLKFTALENESKQNVVSNEEFVKALDENVSEKASNRGWNLVGNPWQCYYNIHTLNFIAPITTYDVNNKKYNAYSIIDDDYAIAPNEAFFVQCPENINSISFPETGRQTTSVIENQQSIRPHNVASAASNRQLVDILLSNGKSDDRTRVVFNESASEEYETTCDASKFFATEGDCPQLYTIGSDGTEYAINERPYNGGNVLLGIIVAQDGTYTFKQQRSNAREVVLFDKETGVTHNFADGDCTFTADAGTYTNRFVLGITKAPETTSVAELESMGITVDTEGGRIQVSGAKGTISIIATDGRTVATFNGEGAVNLSAGTYIVRTTAGATKVVVK